MGALFGHLMEKRNSSVALQAVLTTLTGIDYYAHLSQFDKADNVSIVSFANVNSPGGPFGRKRTATPRGLIAVVALTAAHTILAAVVAARFWIQTTSSRIGDGWQAIAQVASSDIDVLNDGLRAAMMPGAGRNAVGELEEKSGTFRNVYLAEEGEHIKLKMK
jgi:hypothetical protein